MAHLDGSSSAVADRRRADRGDPLVALAHLLETARTRGAWRALALADTAGFLIAGGGVASECEELAAYGPLLCRGEPANDVMPSGLQVLTGATIRRISVDGVEILLCASGEGSEKNSSLAEIELGARRILGRPRSQVIPNE